MPLINNVNELNERIEVLQLEPNRGPEPGETETVLFSCWAKIRTQTIKDIQAQSGTSLENTTEIVIREYQQEKITSTMKIRWKDKTFNIVKVNPDTAFKEYMVLLVKASE